MPTHLQVQNISNTSNIIWLSTNIDQTAHTYGLIKLPWRSAERQEFMRTMKTVIRLWMHRSLVAHVWKCTLSIWGNSSWNKEVKRDDDQRTKRPLCNSWTTKALSSLRIQADWSGHSISAYIINRYCCTCHEGPGQTAQMYMLTWVLAARIWHIDFLHYAHKMINYKLMCGTHIINRQDQVLKRKCFIK